MEEYNSCYQLVHLFRSLHECVWNFWLGCVVVNTEYNLVQGIFPLIDKSTLVFSGEKPLLCCVHPVVVSLRVSFPLGTGEHYTHCWVMVAFFSRKRWVSSSFSHEPEGKCGNSHCCPRMLMRPSVTSCCIDFPEWLWIVSLFEPGFLVLYVLPHIFSKMNFSFL